MSHKHSRDSHDPQCDNKKNCHSHIRNSNDEHDECLICMDEITDNPFICKKGLHKFHPECLYKYQTGVPSGRPACPNCSDIRTHHKITETTRETLRARIQEINDRKRASAQRAAAERAANAIDHSKHTYSAPQSKSVKQQQEEEEDEERRREYAEMTLTRYGNRSRTRSRNRSRSRTRTRSKARSRARSRKLR